MASDRSRSGALISALGAIVLAVAVFLPWYAVGLSGRGAEYLGQLGTQLAERFGNATLHAGSCVFAKAGLGSPSRYH